MPALLCRPWNCLAVLKRGALHGWLGVQRTGVPWVEVGPERGPGWVRFPAGDAGRASASAASDRPLLGTDRPREAEAWPGERTAACGVCVSLRASEKGWLRTAAWLTGGASELGVPAAEGAQCT